jgi:hypothetical protein
MISQHLLRIAGDAAQAWNAVYRIARQMEPIQVVPHGHVERRGSSAFLFIAAYVQVVVIEPPVGKPMDEPRVAVKSEDHGFVASKDGVEIAIG